MELMKRFALRETAACGYTSITFTTQSLSVPLVEANRFTIEVPLICKGCFNASVE